MPWPRADNVINLMDALRQSLKAEGGSDKKKSMAPASARKRATAKRTSRKKASRRG